MPTSIDLSDSSKTVRHSTLALHYSTASPAIESRQLSRTSLAAKRTVDIIGSVLLLVLAAPIIAMAAVVVRTVSPGPAIFRQQRIGRSGSQFMMLKIRTMHTDAEERLSADPHLYKLWVENSCKLPEQIDPRFHTAGPVLRRYSLDELPQLLNVLLGSMSLVGPRPVEPIELNHHYRPLGLDAAYVSMKPGLTGLWQVSGRAGVGHPQKAQLDYEYVRSWTLRGDFKILFRTFSTLFHRHGAH